MTLRKKQDSIREYHSICRTTCCNCPTGCGVKVFLKDNAIVDIYGDEEHPINKGAFCPKGLLSYYHLKNPKRIVCPQIREGLDDPFRTVTWDEALAFTSEKIQDLSGKRGKASVFIHGNESAPFGYLAGGSLFAKHFGTPNTPYRFFPYPFGHQGLIKKMFGVPGSRLLMNPPRDWCSSRCILLYGCDLAASDPITFGPIIDAHDRGTTLLTISSKKTITSSKATLSLRVKPGSQSTILKGIIHILIQKGLFDEDFLRESTTDFDRLRSKVESFAPQSVAKSCWIKKEDLEKMADLIGRTKPLQVIAGDWATRSYLSDEDLLMCGDLVCLRGSVGVPGGGLNLLNVSPFSWEAWSRGNDNISQVMEDVPPNFSLDNILLDSPDRVGALIWYGNPCTGMAEGIKTKAALKEIPFIVHLSSYPNETYNYSHVSFPMSSWLEYSGLVANNNGRAIQWHNKVIDPPGECKSPLAFWYDLAHWCNIGEHFPWNGKIGIIDERKAMDFYLHQNPLTRAASVEKLDPEKNPPGGLLWPCTEEADLDFEESRFLIGRKGNVRGKNILFERHKNYSLSDRRFPTMSGKISLSGHAGQKDTDYEMGFQHQKPVPDSYLSEYDIKYPLILTTGVLVDFVEDFGYFVTDRDTWTANMMVQINPRIAKVLGIENREIITIENDRGTISAPAWLNEDLDPRVIFCPEGFDPYQPHMGCESPLSLFDEPVANSEKKSFTMVTIYKAGQDKPKSKQNLVRFLRNP
ncbi:MAG: molybdopterin-dependent oxidoreductase [Pseudomonadota bacterium]